MRDDVGNRKLSILFSDLMKDSLSNYVEFCKDFLGN